MEGATLLRVLVLCLLGITECLSLEITRLSIPKFVPNGSEESVLLDCEYTYTSTEVRKLVVKWFHEDDPNPVYQWIPELDSKQTSEKFRVNEDYEIPSGNQYTRSRALNIQRPTTELSGRYSCQVQTLEGQDTAEDSMIVYAHPSSVNLNYTISDGTVRVTCDVEGVFPLPEMALFQIEPGEIEHTPIDDVELDYDLENGAYDVELSSDIPEEELESEGLRFFGCTVLLNGTEYEKEVKVPYFPDPVAEKQEVGEYKCPSSKHTKEYLVDFIERFKSTVSNAILDHETSSDDRVSTNLHGKTVAVILRKSVEYIISCTNQHYWECLQFRRHFCNRRILKYLTYCSKQSELRHFFTDVNFAKSVELREIFFYII